MVAVGVQALPSYVYVVWDNVMVASDKSFEDPPLMKLLNNPSAIEDKHAVKDKAQRTTMTITNKIPTILLLFIILFSIRNIKITLKDIKYFGNSLYHGFLKNPKILRISRYMCNIVCFCGMIIYAYFGCTYEYKHKSEQYIGKG